MRRSLIISMAVVVVWLMPATAGAAAAPSLVLSDPVSGALISGGQPSFSGMVSFASGARGQVTIDIYRGTSANGTPVQVLTGSVGSGAFSADATGLVDGTYTAQALASDTPNVTGASQPTTFQVFNGPVQLSLAAPPGPIRTATPTFTATALTATGDASTVYLIIYAGASTDATPTEVVSGAVGAGGAVSIPVAPGLPAGVYTAVLDQPLAGGTAFSGDVAFTISSTAASLSLTTPAPGASEPQTGLAFRGHAGDGDGDSSTIDLALYRGSSATGQPVATARVTRDGSSWRDTWATSLKLGTYTLTATQADVDGRPMTVTRSFQVAPPGAVTGTITISATGRLTAKLACLAGAGTCQGDVLIVTRTALAPEYGGPAGPLALMFQHYRVSAAQTATLTAQLTAAQLRSLRTAAGTRLEVTVAYAVGGKLTESTRETAPIKVG